MKIAFISDTHNRENRIRKMPNADVLIHCGDFTMLGNEIETARFLFWFESLKQYKHKILIAGNHDFMFERFPEKAKKMILDSNIIYLNNESVKIDGVNFYGTPYSQVFRTWAFNLEEDDLKENWKKIPDDTDILITHTPPFGILDETMKNEKLGSKSLKKELKRIKPKIHCFGHIHQGHGIKKTKDTTFINASVMNDWYLTVFDPITITI